MEFPELIKNLPKANLPLEGATGHLLQGKDNQLVFFEIPAGVKLPAHSHGAQWGIIIEGEVELTIGGKTNRYKKGDSYYIKSGEEHQARFITDVKVLDFFEDHNRYSTK